ncbi:MAG: DUF4252 domain-containing protein [Paludibacter sp.]
MKKITTILAALFIFTAVIQAQTLQSLFDRYASDDRFEYVSLGKSMMNMATTFGGVGKNDKQIMSKMNGIKILSLQASFDSPLMKTLENELKQVLDAGNFEIAVEASDKGERVHIYYNKGGKDINDMLIVTKEKGELSIIWMTGKMTKDEMMNSFSSNGNLFQFNNNKLRLIDTIS